MAISGATAEHAESEAPPEPPPPPPSLTTEQRLERLERRYSRISLTIGTAPDPSTSPPTPGAGMKGTLAEILHGQARLTLLVEGDIAARGKAADIDAALRKGRAEWTTWALRVVAGALLLAGVAWGVSILARVRLVEREHQASPHELADNRRRP